ncbi:MAG: hypothetical protein WKG01_36245 [Kofleriaceae bacterium]
MPRSSAQSDFVVRREPPPGVIDLPDGAKAMELPRATLISNEASARATKIVLWATVIMLATLVLLTVIGPHIPSGG